VLLPVLYVWFERERCPTPSVESDTGATTVVAPSVSSEA
jgi:hypothetical protein